MQRRVAVWGAALAVATFAQAGVARAQLPVCPQPSPDQTYYTACSPSGRYIATRLLFDLAIDHVMKADTDLVGRRVGDLLRASMSKETLEKNDTLRSYVDGLDVLKLSRIDIATGTLLLDVAAESRRFAGTIDVGTSPVKVAWDLPERLAGGYWRTPSVLQIAFWEGKRARIDLGLPGGELKAEIECLAISIDGIRIVTSGSDTPDILVRFEECA
jgi:hypothetical protein